MYTPEQKEAIKLLGLDDEQIEVVEQADAWAKKTLKELGIRNPSEISPQDPRAHIYAIHVEAFLKEKGLWEEVGETLTAMGHLSKAEIRKERPFGVVLCSVLRLIA